MIVGVSEVKLRWSKTWKSEEEKAEPDKAKKKAINPERAWKWRLVPETLIAPAVWKLFFHDHLIYKRERYFQWTG